MPWGHPWGNVAPAYLDGVMTVGPPDPPPWWASAWSEKIFNYELDGSWVVYPLVQFGVTGDDAVNINYALAQGAKVRLIPGAVYSAVTPIQVPANGSVISGGGKNGSLADQGTLIQVPSNAPLLNWPQGTGIINLTGLTQTVRDLSLDGNGVAFCELAMVHAEASVRHLIENVACRNKSVGPAIWNLGCEDTTWLKCEVSGSEALAGNQKLGGWMSCPQGEVSAFSCDFFTPVMVNAINWSQFGGNAGATIMVNPLAAQNRSLLVEGSWIYDGSGFSGGGVFPPVSAAIGSDTDASMAGSSNVLTTTSAFFLAGMVGNSIAVYPPGASAPLTGTITGFTNASQVTVSFTNTGSSFSSAFWWAAGGWLGNIHLQNAHPVAQASTTWIQGLLPSNSGVTADGCMFVVSSSNAAGSFTFLTIPTGSNAHTSFKIGPGGAGINYPGTPTFALASGGHFTHINEIQGFIGGNLTATQWSGGTVQTTAPAVPGSTTPLLNPYGCQMHVTISGGTVSAIVVNGVTLGFTSGSVVLPPGGLITLTYTVAPTWTWSQLLPV